jgi:hypothetical protein
VTATPFSCFATLLDSTSGSLDPVSRNAVATTARTNFLVEVRKIPTRVSLRSSQPGQVRGKHQPTRNTAHPTHKISWLAIPRANLKAMAQPCGWMDERGEQPRTCITGAPTRAAARTFQRGFGAYDPLRGGPEVAQARPARPLPDARCMGGPTLVGLSADRPTRSTRFSRRSEGLRVHADGKRGADRQLAGRSLPARLRRPGEHSDQRTDVRNGHRRRRLPPRQAALAPLTPRREAVPRDHRGTGGTDARVARGGRVFGPRCRPRGCSRRHSIRLILLGIAGVSTGSPGRRGHRLSPKSCRGAV